MLSLLILPKLEQVANLTFDEEELTPGVIQTFAYPGGDIPTLFNRRNLRAGASLAKRLRPDMWYLRQFFHFYVT